jgi:predicted SnoaL-like aldol condensation-catalyzing enzyme
MNTYDPLLIALQFNECTNSRDLDGPALLMTDDHVFIDRDRKIHQAKEFMVRAWRQFFHMFPNDKNTFTRIEARGNFVLIRGHAYWGDSQPNDPAIWTATIVHDHVRERHIYADTEQNRAAFNLSWSDESINERLPWKSERTESLLTGKKRNPMTPN